MRFSCVAFAFAIAFAGCSSPGKINADAIDELVADVTARHDAYVLADPALDANKKAIAIRSSALLKKVVDEAKKAKNGDGAAATPAPPK